MRKGGPVQRGSRNPFVAAYQIPDNGGIVSRSTLAKPVTLVFEKDEAHALHQMALRAGDAALAARIVRKIDWTNNVNAKVNGSNRSQSKPRNT